jgi:hypothetical protein
MSNSARRYYQLNRQKYDSACWRPKLSQAARDLPALASAQEKNMDEHGSWRRYLMNAFASCLIWEK